MPAPLLTFNLVGPTPISSGGVEAFTALKPKSHILYTLSQLVASSTYWLVDVFDTTGSAVEALVLRPVASLSATPNMRVVVTMNATGAAGGSSTANIMQNVTDGGTVDAATANMLQVGFAPDVSNNSTWVTGSWNSDSPWGSTVRWSKYWAMSAGDKTTIDEMYLIESSETLMIGTKGADGASSHFMWYGGAIATSLESGSGEAGQRVFGMTTNGSNTINSTFNFTVANSPFGNAGSSNNDHTGFFIVSGGIANSKNSFSPTGANANYWQMAQREIIYEETQPTQADRTPSITSERDHVGYPIIIRSVNTTIGPHAVGIARQAYVIERYPALLTVFSGSYGGPKMGYVWSQDRFNAHDAIFFADAVALPSGSLVQNTPTRPTWRFIPPSRVTVSGTFNGNPSVAAFDVIQTVKSLVVASCSYWQVIETPNTGANSLIIGPKAGVGSSPGMNLVLAWNITGSGPMRLPDVNDATSQYRLQVGLCPNINEAGSGSFKGPQADRPFQSATGNPRWSGYWHCATTGSLSASFLVESEDSILVGWKDNGATSGTFGFIAGALVEGFESSSCEAPGFLYGIITGGASAWGSNFNTADYTAAVFESHGASAAQPHAGVFVVSGSVVTQDPSTGLGQWQNMGKLQKNNNTSLYDWYVPSGSSAAGRAQLAFPKTMVGCVNQGTAPLRALGKVRGILWGTADYGLAAYRDAGSNDLFYRISSQHNAANQQSAASLYLYPASGSGL